MLKIRNLKKVDEDSFIMEYSCDGQEEWGVVQYNPKKHEYEVKKKCSNDYGHLGHIGHALKGALQENRTEYTVMWY